MEGAINPQIQAAWEQLLSAVGLGQIGTGQLSGARQIFVQYWNVPPVKGASLNFLEAAGVGRPAISQVPQPPAVPQKISPQTYVEAREVFDRELLGAAYRETGGNISETARLLGLSRPTVRKRLRAMGLLAGG
jgi:DNA-binding NtrC family response regulator